MAKRVAALGRAGRQPHRMTVLAVTHDLARDRRLAPQRAAELADEPAVTAVVDVHVLASQRRAPAVGAAVAIGLELADAATQQVPL